LIQKSLCVTDGQIDDLLGEIKDRVDRRERVLVTTLTKRMAEDLTEYLQDQGLVRYLHSEINSIQELRFSKICARVNLMC